MRPPSLASRWLREPLVVFLVAGAALFALYRVLNPAQTDAREPTRIVVSQEDLRQLSITWLAQGRPPPTPEQMRSLIENKVREEILGREAIALGLDKDDTIIKRRLAQKMEFLAEDMSQLPEPTRDVLQAWFESHRERFATQPRISFHHLYFSPDTRGTRARGDAEQVLRRLGPANSATGGDTIMLQDRYAERSLDQLIGVFGPSFATELFKLKAGSWQGPVESGYGWHLVYVDDVTPGRVPSFDEVADDVKALWIAEQRQEGKRRLFEAMRSRYEVVIADAPAPPGPAASSAPVSAQRP